MSCGHIGEKNGMPCHRLEPSHAGCHRYYFRPRKVRTATTKEQAIMVPEHRLPEAGAQALDRYADWLAKPGETLYTKIQERLRSMQ